MASIPARDPERRSLLVSMFYLLIMAIRCSVVGTSSQDGRRVPAEREKSKHRKFEAKLKQTGNGFVALVVETYARCGRERGANATQGCV